MYYPTINEFRQYAKHGNLIPVYKEILADTETPVSTFMKIDESEYAYLLESVEGSEKIAQFSFLGSNPTFVFSYKKGEIEINENGILKKTKTKESPFKILKKLLKQYKPVIIQGLPRFHGGAVGFLGYDIIHYIENIPDKNSDELNLPECVFVFTDTILVFDHIKHTVKVVTNAYINKNISIDVAYKEAQKKIDNIIEKLRNPLILEKNNKSNQKPVIKSNITKNEFMENVCKAKEYIKAGDIFQVVLSQRLNVKLTCKPFDVYRALRKINPSPYMYYLRFGELTIVGASPEVFVRVENNKIEIRPIAGTRPRGKDEKEDNKNKDELLSDAKELAEHIMLVDLGRNDLGRVSTYNSVHVSDFKVIEKYSHVMHIVSNISGDVSPNKDIFDCIQATFPAGTVSGAPKIRAMEIIDELENTNRGLYAGAIGYISFSGNLDTCITIRTVVIKDGIAYMQAGAGIVADSVPEKEYEESLNKARSVIQAIEMAEGGLE